LTAIASTLAEPAEAGEAVAAILDGKGKRKILGRTMKRGDGVCTMNNLEVKGTLLKKNTSRPENFSLPIRKRGVRSQPGIAEVTGRGWILYMIPYMP
jgi:hypothetical protein